MEGTQWECNCREVKRGRKVTGEKEGMMGGGDDNRKWDRGDGSS